MAFARMAVPASEAAPIQIVSRLAFKKVGVKAGKSTPACVEVVPRFISTGAPASGLFCKLGSYAPLPSRS